MRYFYLFVLLFVSFFMQAQFETSKRKVNIPAIPVKNSKKPAIVQKEEKPNTITNDKPLIKFESQYFKDPDEELIKKYSQVPKIGENNEPKQYPTRNPAEVYTAKFNQQISSEGISLQNLKQDVFLGQFVVYTKTINISCRDFGAIDGDIIRIWLNGVLVTDNIYLESNSQNIVLDLKEAINIIEIEAMNYGEILPNTGQFNYSDANGVKVTNQSWELMTGYKARIYVEKRDNGLKKENEK